MSLADEHKQEKQKTSRLFALDLIRVIAMLFVVLYHFNIILLAAGIDGTPDVFSMFGRNIAFGQVGVVLFFLLSGFVCHLSFDRKFQGGRFWKECGRFYLKRWLSIVPMFYVGFLATYFISQMQHGIRLDQRVIYNILTIDKYVELTCGTETVSNIGEWFTCILLFFYLVFPFFYLLKKKIGKYIFIAVIVFLRFFGVYFTEHGLGFFHAALQYLPTFLTGMLFSEFMRNREMPLPAAIAGLAITVVVMFVPLPSDGVKGWFLVAAIGIGLFMLIAYIGQKLDNRMSEKSPVRDAIGLMSRYSFPAYLTHRLLASYMAPVIFFSLRGIRFWVVLIVYLGITFFCRYAFKVLPTRL